MDGYFVERSDQLEHHGILGMKWGIRRYQNKDGSYTQEGLRRYNKSMGNYESVKSKYNSIKNTGSKQEIKSVKRELKSAKKDVSMKYDQVKRDYKADQGKNLYQRGHTITANNEIAYKLGAFSAAINPGTMWVLYDNGILNKKMAEVGSLVSIGSAVAAGILSTKNMSEARKLRAYYGHSRPKN